MSLLCEFIPNFNRSYRALPVMSGVDGSKQAPLSEKGILLTSCKSLFLSKAPQPPSSFCMEISQLKPRSKASRFSFSGNSKECNAASTSIVSSTSGKYSFLNSKDQPPGFPSGFLNRQSP